MDVKLHKELHDILHWKKNIHCINVCLKRVINIKANFLTQIERHDRILIIGVANFEICEIGQYIKVACNVLCGFKPWMRYTRISLFCQLKCIYKTCHILDGAQFVSTQQGILFVRAVFWNDLFGSFQSHWSIYGGLSLNCQTLQWLVIKKVLYLMIIIYGILKIAFYNILCKI